MRRVTNDLLKSLRDQVRVVRYSIRAESEMPGAILPGMLQDLRPIMAVGAPALRLADGLFTEVETLATEVIPHDPPPQLSQSGSGLPGPECAPV